MELSDRLKQLIEYYELTPSGLADILDVQRSSISHLLAGRNKPSLDFVMKILEHFPDVDLYWFVNGVGEFPLNQKIEKQKPYTLFSELENVEGTIAENFKSDTKAKQTDVKLNEIEEKNECMEIPKKRSSKNIDQIVIFYTDKSFTNYTPND